MKNFVLGSLLLAALASQTTGCIITSDDEDFATIDAEWSFHTVNPQGQLSPPNPCPAGFDTVALHNQELDASDRPVGAPVIDLFDCVDMRNFSDPLPPAVYETFLSVTGPNGAPVYADSLTALVDVRSSDKTYSAQIADNGGYFKVAWDLRKNGLAANCADIAGEDGVSVTATIAGSTAGANDTFDCEDGVGFTDALVMGTYTVEVTAIDTSDRGIGTPAKLTSKVILDRNRVTDLGVVTLQN